MMRRYNRWHSRFDQPDPYEGSYDFADPQSFNRYSYVQNDPVNFVDPTGLDDNCYPDPITGQVICIPSYEEDGGTVTGSVNDPDTGGLRGFFGSGSEHMGVELGGDPGGLGGISPPQQPTPDALTSNQDILDLMYCLWVKGGYGYQPTERSMWLTQQNNNYAAKTWPWSAESGVETWKGPKPAGSIAVAHTHPDRNTRGTKSSPKPSTTGGRTGRGDQGTADQIVLPVYVVTGQGIWKAIPNGKNPVQVAGSNWYKPSEKAKVPCKQLGF